VRPRILLYTVILVVITGAASWFMAHRIPLKVDIIRDRATLAREADDGSIENLYTLQFMNTEEQPRHYRIDVRGLDGIKLSTAQEIEVPAASLRAVQTTVQVPPEAGKKGANPIFFDISAVDDKDIHLSEKASFMLP